MNETKFKQFAPNIIRTKDHLHNNDELQPYSRGELSIQNTKKFITGQRSKCCLLDGEPFEGEGVRLPIKYDEVLDTFHCVYTFCNLSCAKRYAMSTRSFRPDQIMPIFALMALKLYKVESVIPSPPRETLSKFKDDINCPENERTGYTIEEFRACSPNYNMIEIYQNPFKMGNLSIMSLDASSIIGDKMKIAEETKVPKTLFQPSPYTKMMKQKNDANSSSSSSYLPPPLDLNYQPQPQFVNHPHIKNTLSNIVQK